MPKVTDAHREQMRTRIRQAALAAFQRGGVRGTSMAEIISEAGLSAGAVYGYFRSKDDLIAEVAGELVTGRFDVLRDIARRTPTPPPDVAARELLTSLPPALCDRGLVLEIWSMAARDDLVFEHAHVAMTLMIEGFAAYLQAYFVQEGMDPQAAERRALQTAPVMAGLCQGYIVQRGLVGEAAAETYLDALPLIAFRTD